MKLGIIGGAFDPVHCDHVRMAEGAISELGMDGVILVPSYSSPHKDHPLTDYASRLDMLRIAFPQVGVRIDEIEREMPMVRHYSYLVLPALKQKYAGDTLFFIVGGDSLVAFDTWKNPDVILKQMPLRVFSRSMAGESEAAERLRKKYGADVQLHYLSGLRGASSRQIRAHMALGMPCDLLPQGVTDYAKEHALYAQLDPLIAKERASLSPGLFAHVARTALYAVRLSVAARVEFYPAFVAALLHDCAKECVDSAQFPFVPAAVAHQYAGAIVAQTEYGITDEEILSAIRYHTTGHQNMSQLEKLIYAADKLEEHRSYPGVEQLRSAIESDFEAGFALTVRRNCEYALSRGYELDDNAWACYKQYAQ